MCSVAAELNEQIPPLSFPEGLVAAEPNEQIPNMERSSRGYKEIT
jgi:hypothetical protein